MSAPFVATAQQLRAAVRPRRLLTLADLDTTQIYRLLILANRLKQNAKASQGESLLSPYLASVHKNIAQQKIPRVVPTMDGMSVGLIFTKRSTRTRLAAELSASMLGGRAIYLGKEDIHLGVGETIRDTAGVLNGMLDGVVARVNKHSDIEELAKYSHIPVLNALSDLWHPTQVLADLLTLHEAASQFVPPEVRVRAPAGGMAPLPPLTVAYVGDSTNVLHDMLVTYPRLGHQLRVATPDKYRAPAAVWERVQELNCDKSIWWGTDPKEAVTGADVVVTDTWISMGQEAEKEQRLQDFKGYQVTNALCEEARPHWIFLHCLPRKPDEVDDEVFYGPRSWAFREAANRRWAMVAVFETLFGKPRRTSFYNPSRDLSGRFNNMPRLHYKDEYDESINTYRKESASPLPVPDGEGDLLLDEIKWKEPGAREES